MCTFPPCTPISIACQGVQLAAARTVGGVHLAFRIRHTLPTARHSPDGMGAAASTLLAVVVVELQSHRQPLWLPSSLSAIRPTTPRRCNRSLHVNSLTDVQPGLIVRQEGFSAVQPKTVLLRALGKYRLQRLAAMHCCNCQCPDTASSYLRYS